MSDCNNENTLRRPRRLAALMLALAALICCVVVLARPRAAIAVTVDKSTNIVNEPREDIVWQRFSFAPGNCTLTTKYPNQFKIKKCAARGYCLTWTPTLSSSGSVSMSDSAGLFAIRFKNAGMTIDGQKVDLEITCTKITGKKITWQVGRPWREQIILGNSGWDTTRLEAVSNSFRASDGCLGNAQDLIFTVYKAGTNTKIANNITTYFDDIDQPDQTVKPKSYSGAYVEAVQMLSNCGSTVYLNNTTWVKMTNSNTRMQATKGDTNNELCRTAVAFTIKNGGKIRWSGTGCGTMVFHNRTKSIKESCNAGGTIKLSTPGFLGSPNATVCNSSKTNTAYWKWNYTYTMNAKTGYKLTKLTVDGKSVKVTNPRSMTYTFSSITSDHSIQATYSPIAYTIHFDSNADDATGSMSDQSMTYDKAANLTKNAFARDEYIFCGWNTKPDGSGTSYSDQQSVKNLVSIDGGSITLYAQWRLAPASLQITKTGIGTTDVSAAQSFEVEVHAYEEDGSEASGVMPWTSTDGTSGTVTSGGTVKVKCGETVTVTELPGRGSYSVSEVNVPQGWELTGIDGDSGSCSPNKTSACVITNAYSTVGYWTPIVTKNLIGREIKSGEFEFGLYDSDGELIATAYNEDTGKVEFAELEFHEPGTHTYTVKEIAGDDNDVIYSDKVITFTVTLADYGDGTMSTNVTTDVSPSITNELDPGTLSITKAAEGSGYDTNAEFTVTVSLWDWDGEVNEGEPLADGTIPDGVYYIGSMYKSTHVIDVDSNGSKSGSNVSVYLLNKTDAQIWHIQHYSTIGGVAYYTIIQKSTGLSLDVKSANMANGTNVQTWTKNLSDAQLWSITPVGDTYLIRSKKDPSYVLTLDTSTYTSSAPNRCGNLTISSKSGDTGSAYQRWYLNAISYDNPESAETEPTYFGDFPVTDSKIVLTIKPGQTITIPDLPAGSTYSVEETSMPAGWSLSGTSATSGTIEPNKTSAATLTNSYDPDKAYVTISCQKLLDGVLSRRSFDFELLDSDGKVASTASSVSGKATFDSIAFDEAGTYEYTIREADSGDTTIEHDTHTESVVVTVTDSGGVLAASVAYDDDGAVFSNRTKPGSLSISKVGRGVTDASASTEFTMKVTASLANGLAYETDGSDDAVTFTSGVAYVKVKCGETVTVDNLPDGLMYEVEEVDVPSGWSVVDTTGATGAITGGETSTCSITNEYTLQSAAVSINAKKILIDRELLDQEFEFTLTCPDGTTVTARNDADGNIGFPAVTLDSVGTYTFSLVETVGGDESITYDTATKNVVVDVTDDGLGHLVATVTDGEKTPTFTNDITRGDLAVELVTSGDTTATTGTEFNVTLTATTPDGEPFTGTTTTGSDPVEFVDGKATVTFASKTDGKIGTKISGLPAGTEVTVAEGDLPAGWSLVSIHDKEDDSSNELTHTATVAANETTYVSVENQYTSYGEAHPYAFKHLDSGVLSDGDFTFTVKDTDGNEVSSGENLSDGTVSFTAISANESMDGLTQTLTVSEVVDEKLRGVEWDTHTYTMTISWADNGSGEMIPTISYSGNESTTTFNNIKTTMLPLTGGTGAKDQVLTALAVAGSVVLLTLSLTARRKAKHEKKG